MNEDISSLLLTFGLTESESRVYLALLKLKKGTKTPIVRLSNTSPSKVYDVLDKLIKKGLVTYFIEDGITNYVPVHPSNLSNLFDEKIKEIQSVRDKLQKSLAYFGESPSFLPSAQIFTGWKGLNSVFSILLDDLHKNDTYYILGVTGGENIKKAYDFFPTIDKRFHGKNVKRKGILRLDTKNISEEYFSRFGRKNWEVKYYPTIGPFEIGIGRNCIVLNLMEQEPVSILITNKKIRNSFLSYFEAIWKISKN